MVALPYQYSIPCNIDAEESIIGGILLDPNALPRVAEFLEPKHFYIKNHQEIYRCCLSLASKNELVDLMTVTTALYERKQLDKVGGQGKLAQLVERTVSAVNIDRYAQLVIDKYNRRALVEIGHELADVGSESLFSIEALRKKVKEKLSEWEQSSFNGTDKNNQAFNRMLKEIERIQLGIEDPGFRYWELLRLAKKHNTTIKQIQSLWEKHLISTSHEPVKSWADLMEHEQDFQEWLLQGFAPRKSLVLLHAPGGTGKTRLLYDWIACLLKGEHWSQTENWEGYSVTAPKRKVLIVQTDETKPEMIEALRTRGFNEHLDVKFLTSWSVELMPQLTKVIEEFEPEAILIDSLSSVNRNSLVSENDAEYAKPVLLLRYLADKYNSTIFLVHHSNKQNDIRGSSAIQAAASMVLSLSRDPKHPSPASPFRLLTITKSRSRRPASYSIEADFETGRWTIHGEVDFTDTDLPLKGQILNILKAGKGTRYETEEIAQFLQTSYEVARRNLAQLARDGSISKVRKGKRKLLYFIQWEQEPDALDLLIPTSNNVVKLDIGIKESAQGKGLSDPNSVITTNSHFSDDPKENFETKNREVVGIKNKNHLNAPQDGQSAIPTPTSTTPPKSVGLIQKNENSQHSAIIGSWYKYLGKDKTLIKQTEEGIKEVQVLVITNNRAVIQPEGRIKTFECPLNELEFSREGELDKIALRQQRELHKQALKSARPKKGECARRIGGKEFLEVTRADRFGVTLRQGNRSQELSWKQFDGFFERVDPKG